MLRRLNLVAYSHRASSSATQFDEEASNRSTDKQNDIQSNHSRFIGMAIDSIAAQKERKTNGTDLRDCSNGPSWQDSGTIRSTCAAASILPNS